MDYDYRLENPMHMDDSRGCNRLDLNVKHTTSEGANSYRGIRLDSLPREGRHGRHGMTWDGSEPSKYQPKASKLHLRGMDR